MAESVTKKISAWESKSWKMRHTACEKKIGVFTLVLCCNLSRISKKGGGKRGYMCRRRHVEHCKIGISRFLSLIRLCKVGAKIWNNPQVFRTPILLSKLLSNGRIHASLTKKQKWHQRKSKSEIKEIQIQIFVTGGTASSTSRF